MNDFSEPLPIFMESDIELKDYYKQGKIKEYRIKFLFQDDSDLL